MPGSANPPLPAAFPSALPEGFVSLLEADDPPPLVAQKDSSSHKGDKAPLRWFFFDFLQPSSQFAAAQAQLAPAYRPQFNPQVAFAAAVCPSADDGAFVGCSQPPPRDAYEPKRRALFSMSPFDRPAGVPRSTRSGRELTELEALQRKHSDETAILVPVIVDALRGVSSTHEVAEAAGAVSDALFDAFNTSAAVVTSLLDFVSRLADSCYTSPAALVVACLYLDRLLRQYPRLLITRRRVYKLFGTALRVASKMVDMKSINNKNFAAVVGISNGHLNDLETKLLLDLHFAVLVSPAEFFWFARRLVPEHPAVQRLLDPNGPNVGYAGTAVDSALEDVAGFALWPMPSGLAPEEPDAADDSSDASSAYSPLSVASRSGVWPSAMGASVVAPPSAAGESTSFWAADVECVVSRRASDMSSSGDSMDSGSNSVSRDLTNSPT